MANAIFLGVSATWDTAGNWSTGAAPVDTNDIIIAQSSQDLTTNLDQRSVADIDPNSLRIYGTYTGSIGTVSTALKLDDVAVDCRVDVNGGANQILNLDLDSCPLAIVTRTGPNPYACYFSAGTITNLWVGSGVVRIGASATVTKLMLYQEPNSPPPIVYIDTGATITDIYGSAGTIESTAGLATVHALGDLTLKQHGDSAGAITTLVVGERASVRLLGDGTPATGYTVGTLIMAGGRVNTTESGKIWTFTTTLAGAGGLYTKTSDVFTNAPQVTSAANVPAAATRVAVGSID